MLTPEQEIAIQNKKREAEVIELSLRLLADLNSLKIWQLRDEIKDLKRIYTPTKNELRDLFGQELQLFNRRSGGFYTLTRVGVQQANILFSQDPPGRYSIYRIQNRVNDLVYIGKTNDPERRKKEHFSKLRTGTHNTVKLQNAFDEYGLESFDFEVIEKDIRSYRVAAREIRWIKDYDAVRNGYNGKLPETKNIWW